MIIIFLLLLGIGLSIFFAKQSLETVSMYIMCSTKITLNLLHYSK